MMRRNGSRDIFPCGSDELYRVGGGDMFQHHAQSWEAGYHRCKVSINEDFFSVENINIVISHFAMDQQG